MPLPSDEKLVKLSEDLITGFETIFGKHPGLRPAHAKGIMATGTFTPSPAAASLSSAPHFTTASTPITVRFSSSTGIPQIPDTDPNANPRGLGIRFNLGQRKHTDIIAHSTPLFPTRTGEEFLQFLKALADGSAGEFLAKNPATRAFAEYPKPSPASFANEAYYGVSAFKFVNAEGAEKFGRYIITPLAGEAHLNGEQLAAKSETYLYDELPAHLASGPASWSLKVQVAEEGDVTDDSTAVWPSDRPIVELGTLQLDAILPGLEKEQMHIIYDPIPRIQGIEPSDDPLLELRAAIYLISGRRRRAVESGTAAQK